METPWACLFQMAIKKDSTTKPTAVVGIIEALALASHMNGIYNTF